MEAQGGTADVADADPVDEGPTLTHDRGQGAQVVQDDVVARHGVTNPRHSAMSVLPVRVR